MKSTDRAQSATSLPRAPRDEASARSRRYLIMMGVRILCFILMVAITPYGWYTWVLGLAAIFLPYIAVVTANVASNVSVGPERPDRALPAQATAPSRPETDTGVLRIDESGPAADAAPGSGRDDTA